MIEFLSCRRELVIEKRIITEYLKATRIMNVVNLKKIKIFFLILIHSVSLLFALLTSSNHDQIRAAMR